MTGPAGRGGAATHLVQIRGRPAPGPRGTGAGGAAAARGFGDSGRWAWPGPGGRRATPRTRSRPSRPFAARSRVWLRTCPTRVQLPASWARTAARRAAALGLRATKAAGPAPSAGCGGKEKTGDVSVQVQRWTAGRIPFLGAPQLVFFPLKAFN